jgi:dodecin
MLERVARIAREVTRSRRRGRPASQAFDGGAAPPQSGADRHVGATRGEQEDPMTNKVFKTTEVVGVSDQSFEQAIRNAVAKASETLRHLDWFEVVEQRGALKDNAVAEFQITLKLGFRLE